MKKIILSILAIILVIGYGCDDNLLNTKPHDKFTEEDVWNDPNLVQSFIYKTQESILSELLMTGISTSSDGAYAYVGALSDNELSVKQVVPVVENNLDQYYDAGWNSFLKIRNCNLIISKVKESKSLKKEDKPRLEAQGKFLRACVYYDKAKLFGGYVIIDKVLSMKDNLSLPRSSMKATYDFVIKDLQEAAKDLPVASKVPVGSITKGAADALLAEVALQAAAYIGTDKDNYYKISKEASEELFSMNYSLDSDYASLSNKYSGDMGSKEIILAKWFSKDKKNPKPMDNIIPASSVTQTSGTPKLTSGLKGFSDVFPTCSLVHAYLVTDIDGNAKIDTTTSYYKNWKSNGGYVSKALYVHRDARFETSIVRDSTKLFDNLITLRKGGNLYPGSVTQEWAATTTGYYVRKGIDESFVGFNGSIPIDFHLNALRLGRSYLNYAEVMLRLGDTDKAIEYINKTRVRHGKLPALAMGLSSTEAWKWYKIERRVELFSENDRYWSLLRWGKEDNLDVIPELNKKVPMFMEISEDGKSYKEIPVVLRASDFQFDFTSRRYLFPVPQNSILENSKLTQNPGYGN